MQRELNDAASHRQTSMTVCVSHVGKALPSTLPSCLSMTDYVVINCNNEYHHFPHMLTQLVAEKTKKQQQKNKTVLMVPWSGNGFYSNAMPRKTVKYERKKKTK